MVYYYIIVNGYYLNSEERLDENSNNAHAFPCKYAFDLGSTFIINGCTVEYERAN